MNLWALLVLVACLLGLQVPAEAEDSVENKYSVIFASKVKEIERRWKIELEKTEEKYFDEQKQLLTEALEKYKEAAKISEQNQIVDNLFADSFLKLYLLLIDNESSSFCSDLLEAFKKKHPKAYSRAYKKLLPEDKETIHASLKSAAKLRAKQK